MRQVFAENASNVWNIWITKKSAENTPNLHIQSAYMLHFVELTQMKTSLYKQHQDTSLMLTLTMSTSVLHADQTPVAYITSLSTSNHHDVITYCVFESWGPATL